jgi:U4/U6 small nuclear ribonucleoprotein PRP31
VGILEDDPEYRLIVEANEIAAEITNEIILVHKFILHIYSKKFSDLGSLVPTPIDYIQTVRRIGNETDLTLVDLSDILPPAQIMIVVTASTAGGKTLTKSDLQRVEEACEEANVLDAGRNKILSFVESRMNTVAPNLSKLVGSSIAARLMAEAGLVERNSLQEFVLLFL